MQKLRLVVDTEVRLPVTAAPRGVIEALRRELRQHGAERLPALDGSAARGRAGLLRAERGFYLLPQALLPRVVEVCRRHGLACEVVDQRTVVPCAPLRSRLPLTPGQETALRTLLLRDSAVIVVPDAADRVGLAAALIARRQQRTTVVTTASVLPALRAQLGRALGLEGAATDDVVVCSYDEAGAAGAARLRTESGLIVCDGLQSVEAPALLRVLSQAGSRYLLGLASEPGRPDGLEAPLYGAVGERVHELPPPSAPRGVVLHYRRRASAFGFAYQGREHYQNLLAALALDETRTALVVDDVVGEVGAGRACVVLSERRDHLERLRERLPAAVAALSETITSDVRPAERSAIVARFNRAELSVLLATGQIVSESLPVARAGALFVAFPFSYERKLERIVGALMQPSPNKSEVVVYDYDDVEVPPLHRACEKRMRVLARLQRSAQRDYLRWAQMELSF
ncbi:MAG: hypothetical protein IPG96_01310 [Proteobacteria bacterium]|nr:hypothetical protein [Pseudomonadota bacterium]